MGFQTFDERQLYGFADSIDDSDSPGTRTLMVPPPNGGRVDQLLIVNSDVVDHLVTIYQGGINDWNSIGSLTIPARAGFDGTKAVEAVSALVATTVWIGTIWPNGSLQVGTPDTMGAGTFLGFNVFGGYF